MKGQEIGDMRQEAGDGVTGGDDSLYPLGSSCSFVVGGRILSTSPTMCV